jgi:hypothetical protein
MLSPSSTFSAAEHHKTTAATIEATNKRANFIFSLPFTIIQQAEQHPFFRFPVSVS